MVIYYQGRELDGQTVTLVKSCVPASPVQPYMCIDSPNFPNGFDLFGIAMMADKAVNVHDVLLHFSAKVSQAPSSSCWKQSDKEGKEYSCFLNGQTIPAQLPISVAPFYGTPLPSQEMKITVSVFYASKKTQATFTLKSPN